MSGRREGPAGGAKAEGRILVASLTLCFLVTAGAAWWYYTRQLAAIEDAAIRELTAVCESKTRQIASWRSERLGDGHVQMASPVMGIAARILSGRGSSADRTGWLDVMARLQDAFLYTGASLSDLNGGVKISTSGASTDTSRLRALASEALRTKKVQLTDLSLDSGSGRPMMALVIPIEDLGVIVLDIDPQRFLYPYLRTWTGGGQTAETLIVRRNGETAQYLSELRYHPSAPLRFSRSLAGLGVPPDSVLDKGSFLRGPDYRGVPVFAIIRRVPDSPWYVTTKIDAAEVDAPAQRLGFVMALVIALIVAVAASGGGLVWVSQRARILKEREAWFQAATNETPAYLWMASVETENSFINTPFARFLGTDANRLMNTWSDYLHPDDAGAARAIFLESLRTQSGYLHEFRIRRHDGEYRWAVSAASPRFSPEGTFLGFAGSLFDITERRVAEQQLREANASLEAALAESTHKEREIHNLSARLINAHEEERKRLARELHDDLSQQIAALSMAAGNVKRQIPEDLSEARAQSDRIHGKLVQLAAAVRRISHELHPAILQYSGIGAALRAYCEEFGALTGIHLSFDIEGSFEGLSPAIALCLFRTAQEATRNVAKHAGVSTASIELKRANGVVKLTVSDAGVGLEPYQVAAEAGLGLLNIKERARLVSGTVEIRTSPGQGTSVTVEVPE